LSPLLCHDTQRAGQPLGDVHFLRFDHI
jgi:hypothetical protein